VIEHLPGLMMQQAYLTVGVFREAFRVRQQLGGDENLRDYLEHLVDQIKGVMPKGWIGRIFKPGDGAHGDR
jgi:hypothetical protein